MKKTLIAVAALSAMAASAMAANVTVSGVVDLGLNFQNVKKAGDTTRTFTMNAGQNSGSRVKFAGSEELGNDVVVGFQLESGFKADTGILEDTNNIFRRESRLYVKTAFGTIHAGRFGALESGTGSVSIFGGDVAFGTGWGDTIMKTSSILEGLTTRYDNSIAYQSPVFAGLSLYLMHSFKESSQKLAGEFDKSLGDEGRPTANQYNGVGLKYANGPFNAAFVASLQNYGNGDGLSGEVKNGKTFSLSAAYDFGVCKVAAEGQYFNKGKFFSDFAVKDNNLDVPAYKKGNKGWGSIISVTAPVAGGKVLASVGYKDAEKVEDSSTKNKVWNAGLAYTYNLSKRTMLYAAAGYTENKTEKTAETTKVKTTEVITGIVHKF